MVLLTLDFYLTGRTREKAESWNFRRICIRTAYWIQRNEFTGSTQKASSKSKIKLFI